MATTLKPSDVIRESVCAYRIPSAENPCTTTNGTPWPHTATPTSWPLSSLIRCRASWGIVTRPNSGASSVVSGPTIGVVTSPVTHPVWQTPRSPQADAGLVAVALHLGAQLVD